MRRQQLSQSEQEQDDEYQKQQRGIQNLIQKYKERSPMCTNRSTMPSSTMNSFFKQTMPLQQSGHGCQIGKFSCLIIQAQVNMLKNQKATQNQETNARNFVTKAHIEVLGQKNNQAFKNMQQNIEQAIQISTFIKAELQKQIQDLDRVYETNKDINVRIKRSMDGLRIMLRRIMMSKFTRFLSIITVLTVIALIVVYVLKNNGTI